jgi:hypothetical protein
MKIKIEIKNKLEDNYNFFYWRVKLKRKINLIKGQNKRIKRMRIKLKKIIYHKLGLNDEIENKSKFYKWFKNKN